VKGDIHLSESLKSKEHLVRLMAFYVSQTGFKAR
jgi:hypothetical protein